MAFSRASASPDRGGPGRRQALAQMGRCRVGLDIAGAKFVPAEARPTGNSAASVTRTFRLAATAP
jgi:hypothetical protein